MLDCNIYDIFALPIEANLRTLIDLKQEIAARDGDKMLFL